MTALIAHDVLHLWPGLSLREQARRKRIRKRLVEASGVVIGLSEGAIDDIPSAHYVGHGCDDVWASPGVDDAAEPADLRGIPRPRAIYIGALSVRVCAQSLAAVAASGVQVVVLGYQPSLELQRVIDTNESVHFLGSRAPAQTPPYLLHSDVGIVPHTDEPFTRSMEPHKRYNYSSAGLRSVALNCVVPPLLASWVTPTSTVQDFVDATRAAVREGRLTSDQIRASRSLTWGRVAREILRLTAPSSRAASAE